MSEKTTDARECPRCHKQVLVQWIEDNGRTLIGDRCGACNATWMLDMPQRIAPPPGDAVERVTDEELAEIARLGEDGDGGFLVRLAAEVIALRSKLRTIDVELDHAGAPTGPEDGSGVYTADGRIIALGLDVAALRAEAAERVKSLAAVSASLIMARAEIERLKRENAVLADDASRAPKFVPFAGGEVS